MACFIAKHYSLVTLLMLVLHIQISLSAPISLKGKDSVPA